MLNKNALNIFTNDHYTILTLTQLITVRITKGGSALPLYKLIVENRRRK